MYAEGKDIAEGTKYPAVEYQGRSGRALRGFPVIEKTDDEIILEKCKTICDFMGALPIFGMTIDEIRELAVHYEMTMSFFDDRERQSQFF